MRHDRKPIPVSAGQLALVRLGVCVLTAVLSLVHGERTVWAEGWLDAIRSDVRTSDAGTSKRAHRDRTQSDDEGDWWGPLLVGPADDEDACEHDFGEDDDAEMLTASTYVQLTFGATTSPWWGPHVMLADDFQTRMFFARFPYDSISGYMLDDFACDSLAMEDQTIDRLPPIDGTRFREKRMYRLTSPGRRWAGRFRTEYADTFGRLQRTSGHLLLSTSSRWGLDSEMGQLSETFADGTHDELFLGDFNLIFRFAQSDRMQWRTGLGLNWLDDPTRTDVGFNFTYGVDAFPANPWVFSSTLDWGTLGHADLFRFRTTAGVLVRNVEVYTGYEYFDLGRTQTNNLLAGLRLWF